MSARDRASAKRAEAPINTLEQFRARCAIVASRYAIGRIDLIEAVDTLQDFAFTRGLVDEIGQDEVQAVLSALASMQSKERTDEYEGLSSTFARACLAADEVLQRHQEPGMSNEPLGKGRDEQEASKGPRFRLRALKDITLGSDRIYLIKGSSQEPGLWWSGDHPSAESLFGPSTSSCTSRSHGIIGADAFSMARSSIWRSREERGSRLGSRHSANGTFGRMTRCRSS
jgi:hypothetical protein